MTIQSMTTGVPGKTWGEGAGVLQRVGRGLYDLNGEPGAASAQPHTPRRGKVAEAARRVTGLKESFADYLEAYDRGGPFRREGQLQHHVETIRRRQHLGSVAGAIRDPGFLANLHAVLRAWGIGSRGSRLADPSGLGTAFEQHLPEIEALEGLLISEIDQTREVIDRLWFLVSTIPIVDNKSRIVPVTKALHHLLPDLVVPVDRAWTGAFFAWNMPNFDQHPERVFRSAYEAFFDIARAVRPEAFVGDGWRSCPAKIIDNGLVGYCLVNRIQPTSGQLPPDPTVAVQGALLSERFDRALKMASDLHRSQQRKGTDARPVPYLAHVLAVVSTVLADEPDEVVAIAAALHDGPEDQGGRPILERIRNEFGLRVAEIVESCSDTFEQPKPAWAERKKAFLARLAATKDRQALVVKCADCLANARDTLLDYQLDGNRVWDRFKAMPCASNQIWWYASCRDALIAVSDTRAFRQLDAVVNRLLEEVEPCPGSDHEHLTVVC